MTHDCMSKVIIGKGKNKSCQQAGYICLGKIVGQPERYQPAQSKAENQEGIKHLWECHQSEQKYADEAVEWRQVMHDERQALWIKQIGCLPGRLVQLRNGFVYPPQIPVAQVAIAGST